MLQTKTYLPGVSLMEALCSAPAFVSETSPTASFSLTPPSALTLSEPGAASVLRTTNSCSIQPRRSS